MPSNSVRSNWYFANYTILLFLFFFMFQLVPQLWTYFVFLWILLSSFFLFRFVQASHSAYSFASFHDCFVVLRVVFQRTSRSRRFCSLINKLTIDNFGIHLYQEIIKAREWISHTGLIPEVIPLKVGVYLNLREILGSLKRDLKRKKFWNATIRQLIANERAPRVGGQLFGVRLPILREKLFIPKYTQKSPKTLRQNSPKHRYVRWAEGFLTAWNLNEISAFKP